MGSNHGHSHTHDVANVTIPQNTLHNPQVHFIDQQEVAVLEGLKVEPAHGARLRPNRR
jgi:hypothetical protein